MIHFILALVFISVCVVPVNVVTEGDSLTSGTGSATAGRDYPRQLVSLLGGNITLHNFAVGGSTLTVELPARATQVDSVFVADPWTVNVFIPWAGTNDMKLFDLSGEAAYALYKAYSLPFKTKAKVVAVTALPRYSPTTPPGFEANRQVFNALVRSDGPTWANGVADVAADPRIGAPGAQFNPVYYSDQVHLNDAGYAIVAAIVATAVKSL